MTVNVTFRIYEGRKEGREEGRKERNASLNVVRKLGISFFAFNEFGAIVLLNSVCHAGSIICC
jgi:hypothetical protein